MYVEALGDLWRFYCASGADPLSYVSVLFIYCLNRFVAHLLAQAVKLCEAASPTDESTYNSVRSGVVNTVSAQEDIRSDVVELNVRLSEEKDGRENTE